MINARTWHRLCISAYVMFPAIFVAGWLPDKSLLIWPAVGAIVWGLIVAALGAVQGILLACGRLHWGCPLCNARSFVSGGDRDGMNLGCPHCGELRLKIGRLGPLRVIRPESVVEDEEAVEEPASLGSLLLAPKRHFVPFIIIFLPVVASVVAASYIHEFSFFYILIPGFWCYAVGGVLLDGIFSGRITDSDGTVVRRKSPVRFWGKIGIWSLAYIFAMVFPIGYAMQERDRQDSPSERQGDGGPPTARPESR